MGLSRALRQVFIPPTVRSSLASANQRDAVVGPGVLSRYAGINGTMMSEWDAEAAIRQAYLVNSTVYRCVTIIAETIASLPFRAGMDQTRPEHFDTKAPLAMLLGPPPGSPNPDATPSDLWANAIAQYIVTGRFGWEIEWSGAPAKRGSEVVALWPLISQYLFARPTDGGTRYFKNYQYRTYVKPPKDLEWEQCFYMWRPSLQDWRQPESALQAARLEISTLVEQSIYDYAFLKNGSVPANLVVTQAFETKQGYDAFKAQFGHKFGGAANAGKTMFAEFDAEDGNIGQMVDVKILGTTQRDSDAIKRVDQLQGVVCRALGVPESKLDSSNRTYSNASEEDATYERNTIIPLCTRLQEAINIRLAPYLGKEIGWFDVSGLSIMQDKKEGSAFKQISPIEAWETGAASLNEARKVMDLKPLDGGDEVKGLTEGAPVPELLKLPDVHVDAPGTVPADQPEEPIEPGKTVQKSTESLTRADNSPADKVKSQMYENKLNIYSNRATRRQKAFFARQNREIIANLRSQRSKRAASPVFDRQYWNQQLQNDSQDSYNETTLAFGTWQMSMLPTTKTFNANSQQVTDWTANRSQTAANLVNTTTEKDLESVIADYEDSGDESDLEDAINSYFTSSTVDNRASLWGDTEIAMAAGFAMSLAARDSGVVQGKYWIVDGNPCPICLGNLDDDTIPLDESFSSGDSEPGIHPGCKCSIGYETISGRSAQPLVRSASQTHTGVMVAFMLDPETASKLSIDGGEPVDQLHCTLAYLGKTSDEIDRSTLERAVKLFAATQPPLTGKISGKGIFETPDGKAVVGLVDVPGLAEMRTNLVGVLQASDIPVSLEHDFTPHVTLAYVDSDEDASMIDAQAGTALSFNEMTVAWGDEKTGYSLSKGRGAKGAIKVGRVRSAKPLDDIGSSLPLGSASDDPMLENLLANSIKTLLKRQYDSTMSRLEGKRGRQWMDKAQRSETTDISSVFNSEYWETQSAEDLKAPLLAVASMANMRFCLDSKLKSPVSPSSMDQFIQQRADDLSQRLTRDISEKVSESLLSAAKSKQDLISLKQRMSSVFEQSDISPKDEISVVYNEVINFLKRALKHEYEFVDEVERELLRLATNGASVGDS